MKSGTGESVVSVPKEAATNLLNDWHQRLCDDFRQRDQAAAVIDACVVLGLITSDERRLRLLALSSCPGHDSPRGWCAYCGTVKEEE